MSESSPVVILVALLTLLAGVVVGYWFANRRNRKQRRLLQLDLNQQSLQLLEVKKELSKLETRRNQFARKDRLLKHTLKKLASVTTLTNQFDELTQAQDRKHFIQLSEFRVAAAEARQQAQRAAKVAIHTDRQLKKLEALNKQTINAPVYKSDVVRLSRMRSSNESRRFNANSLQALDGIGPALERTLNAAGIHHIEQLANISDRELLELPIPTTEAKTVAARAIWKSGAKEWLEKRSNA